MAMYMAAKIMEGRFQYSILKFKMYQRYQADVDAILIAEGREDLIKH